MAKKRFQETVNIQPSDMRTGQAQGLMSLSDRLQEFKSLGSGMAQQGFKAIAQAQMAEGTSRAQSVKLRSPEGELKQPEYEESGLLDKYEVQAFNKTLQAAYLSSLNNDIRVNVSRIQAQNKNDLLGFNDQVKAWANGLLGGVDQSAKFAASRAIEERTTAARIAVQKETIDFQRQEAQKQIELGAKTSLDDATRLASEGYEGAATKALESYNGTVDSLAQTGMINQGDAHEKKRQAALQTYTSNLIGNVRRYTQKGQTEKALNLVRTSRDTIPTGMSEPEHQKFVSSMIAEMNEGFNLMDKKEGTQAKTLKLYHDENYASLSIALAEGRINRENIFLARQQKKINNGHLDKLLGKLQTQGQGIDDWFLYNNIQESIRDGVAPGVIRNEIIANMGNRLTSATASELLRDVDSSMDKEWILNTANSKRAVQFLEDYTVPVGIMGTIDFDKQRDFAELHRQFSARVLAGEKPWNVVDELVVKSDFDKMGSPMFGTKENPGAALEKLKEKQDTMSVPDFDYEFNKLTRMIIAKELLDKIAEQKKAENAESIR